MQILLDDVCDWLQQEKTETNTQIAGACVDSRSVQKGQLFFALQGERTDGHLFLKQAWQKGASALVIQEDFEGDVPDAIVFRVKDTLCALQCVAKAAFNRTKASVIAITGSFGKTTTKEWIKTFLEEEYLVAATHQNQNSQVGLPLTLLNQVQGDEDYIVLEMGMTEKGHIEQLVQLVPPKIAVVTQVALIHAENFESIEEIAEAKREIFSQPETEIALVYNEARAFDILVEETKANVYTYGQKGDAPFLIQRCQDSWQVTEKGVSKKLSIPHLTAEHLSTNCLAAIAVARLCGVSWEAIERGATKIAPYKNRMQVVEKNGITFINDSYNAAEDTTICALEHIRKQCIQGKKIAVLGGIKELGAFTEECHKVVAKHALLCVDTLFCFGEEAKIYQEVWQENNRDAFLTCDFAHLVETLQERCMPGDMVLLKGSCSYALWRVLDELQERVLV